MADKLVKMNLSENGYKRFQTVMKKFGFKKDDYFLKYCVLKTIRTKVADADKKTIDKELKLLKE